MGRLAKLDLSYRYVCLFSLLIASLIFSQISFAEDLSKDKWRIESAVNKTYENGRKTVELRATKGVTINGSYKQVTTRAVVVADRSAVGRTFMKRLFSRNAVAIATVVGIEFALRKLGYEFDHSNGTVYVPSSDSNIGWSGLDGNWYNDPNKWGQVWVNSYNNNGASPQAVFNRTEVSENGTVYLYVDRTYGTETYTTNIASSAPVPNPNPNPSTPKVLTPEAIGDIILGNPPDPSLYPTDSPLPSYPHEVSPDLPNLYKPVDDSSYPSYSDSTVITGQDALDKSDPVSSDTTINTEVNPDGGSKSFLPNFCDWATPVCSFINWFKDDSQVPEPETYNIQEYDKSKLPTAPQFSFNSQCPSPKTFNLNLGLASTQISLPYDYFCSFATDVRPFVILAAWLHACFIFAGFVRS
ncbi:virulence factor TspB C-terminal domain-related protein [Acinetobacter baumannii]